MWFRGNWHVLPIGFSILALVLTAGLSLNSVRGHYRASHAASLSDQASLYQALGKPYRAFDSRIVNPIPCGFSSGKPVAGGSTAYITIRTDCLGFKNVPVQAVEANLTVIGAPSAGYAVLYAGATRPNTASIVYNPNDTVSSHVTLPVSNGAVTLYTTSTAHFTLDIFGFYTMGTDFATGYQTNSLATGSYYHAYFTPIRYMDTRGLGSIDSRRTKLQGENVVAIPSNILPAGATALVGRITVVDPEGAGYVATYGTAASNVGTADLLYNARQTIGNEFVTAVSAGSNNHSVFYFNSTSKAHIVIDILGYYDTTPGGINSQGYEASFGAKFYPLAVATRLFDSRSGQQSCSSSASTGPIPAAVNYHPVILEDCAGIPNRGVTKILTGTVTTVNPRTGGYLRLSGLEGQGGPHASLNFGNGLYSNGYHMLYDNAPDGHPSFTVYSTTTTDVILDATGYFLY